MQKNLLPRTPRVYVTLLLLWLILVMLMPRIGKFNYDYRKGTPWAYETLVAQFDFPLLKTQEQLKAEREEAGSNIVPYYRWSEEAAARSIGWADSVRVGDYPLFSRDLSAALKSVYGKGVLPDGASVQSSPGIVFIQKDKRAGSVPAAELHTLATARKKLLSQMSAAYPSADMDSLLEVTGAYSAILPNLIFDSETSALVHARDMDFLSPTLGMVGAGELIVSKGEIVTAEIHQMLDSYKAEYENSIGYSGSAFMQWAGNILIALSIVLILFLSVFYTNPSVFGEFNRFLYLVFIFALSAAAAFTIDRVNPALLYLAPFTLTAFFLLAFFKLRVVLPVYIVSLIPMLVYVHNGVELFVIYLTSGVVVMYAYQYLNRGWQQFLMSVVSFSAAIVAYFGFRMVSDIPLLSDIDNLYRLFIASLLAVAGYPLIYLFERLFGLVSGNRLMELCDANGNRLLTELAQKAPGTFQHCLQVMNMADHVASAMGANVLLVRAGSLYHDIGKMMNPMCFIENSPAGGTYHSDLSPRDSAKDIVKHVTDGLALADRYGLPDIVKDFILTHHGTSCATYFYNRYINDGGDPADSADFHYKGKNPWTKEQAILMICDTVEAASRTLKDNSRKTFDSFVENIVNSKIDAGLLSEADITLKEISQIKALLKDYLTGLYHGRIAYPKRRR